MRLTMFEIRFQHIQSSISFTCCHRHLSMCRKCENPWMYAHTLFPIQCACNSMSIQLSWCKFQCFFQSKNPITFKRNWRHWVNWEVFLIYNRKIEFLGGKGSSKQTKIKKNYFECFSKQPNNAITILLYYFHIFLSSFEVIFKPISEKLKRKESNTDIHKEVFSLEFDRPSKSNNENMFWNFERK